MYQDGHCSWYCRRYCLQIWNYLSDISVSLFSTWRLNYLQRHFNIKWWKNCQCRSIHKKRKGMSMHIVHFRDLWKEAIMHTKQTKKEKVKRKKKWNHPGRYGGKEIGGRLRGLRKILYPWGAASCLYFLIW